MRPVARQSLLVTWIKPDNPQFANDRDDAGNAPLHYLWEEVKQGAEIINLLGSHGEGQPREEKGEVAPGDVGHALAVGSA